MEFINDLEVYGDFFIQNSTGCNFTTSASSGKIIFAGSSGSNDINTNGQALGVSVNFDGPGSLIGEFVDIDITEALANSLRGRISRLI